MMNSKAPVLYKISRVVLGPIFKWYYNPKIVNTINNMIPAIYNNTGKITFNISINKSS